MPQLNPYSWFLIFFLSWSVYLVVLTKINNLKMINKAILKHNKNVLKSWIWLWA